MANIHTEIKEIRGMLDVNESIFLNRLAEKVVIEQGEKAVLCEIGSFCGKSTFSGLMGCMNMMAQKRIIKITKESLPREGFYCFMMLVGLAGRARFSLLKMR